MERVPRARPRRRESPRRAARDYPALLSGRCKEEDPGLRRPARLSRPRPVLIGPGFIRRAYGARPPPREGALSARVKDFPHP
ncbi:MAG: hypothetical protein MZV70_68395 [Desulfobacterales bacterium]|nr:hypothetical protein [Desulfobacterales bacterium]